MFAESKLPLRVIELQHFVFGDEFKNLIRSKGPNLESLTFRCNGTVMKLNYKILFIMFPLNYPYVLFLVELYSFDLHRTTLSRVAPPKRQGAGTRAKTSAPIRSKSFAPRKAFQLSVASQRVWQILGSNCNPAFASLISRRHHLRHFIQCLN